MGKVLSPDFLANIKTLDDLKRFLSLTLGELVQQVNGKLSFVQNIEASGPHELTFLASGVNMEIAHTLSRVPTGFIVVSLNADMRVWRPSSPGTEWNDKKAYLTSSGAGTVSVYIV